MTRRRSCRRIAPALYVLTALGSVLAGTIAQAQTSDLDAVNDRHLRERELRLSQQSPRALIDNVVVQRLRPEYDAAGISLGGFRIYPKIGLQLVYDTNVFQTPRAEYDQEAMIEPSVAIQSNWERHSLGLTASASVQRFARHQTENLENYDVALNGVLDFGLGGHLFGTAHIQRDNESRGTIGDLFPGGEPVRYTRKQLYGAIEEHLPGVFARLDGDFSRYRYDDVLFRGDTFSQAYRNRDELRTTAQAAFKLNAGLAFFTELSANRADYPDQQAGADFSSHGESVLVGFTFQEPSLLSGEIGIGYLHQKYDTLPIPPVNGPSYDLALIWNVTPLLTITTNAHRAIQQTPFVQAPSIIESRFSTQADYELLRNLLINVKATLVLDDFGGPYAVDSRFEQMITAQFLISRTLRATASIEHRNQRARSSFLRPYEGYAVKIGMTAQR